MAKGTRVKMNYSLAVGRGKGFKGTPITKSAKLYKAYFAGKEEKDKTRKVLKPSHKKGVCFFTFYSYI